MKEQCLLCHYSPNDRDQTHLPSVTDEDSGVYVCKECVVRAQSVTHLGLTIHELKIAVDKYLDLGY